NIVVEVENGELKTCRFEVVETPRFFEAMLRGRPYTEASHITSRICGICATGHATASLRASEKALGVELSEQSWLLRKLTFHGEILDSHILHVYMLVAPDFLGVGSVIPLVGSHPEVVLRALRMKKLAGDLCAMVTGRHTHPIAMVVGGFTHFPKMSELEAMRQRLIDSRKDVEATVELFSKLPWPEFERDTEYVSLSKPDEYAFIDGDIVTSDGVRVPPERYKEVTNEFMVPHSTAKFTRNKRESLMVGALARFNNNYDLLDPKAKEAAAALGMKPKVTNTFLNSAAQVVEIVHSTEDSIRIIEELLNRGVQPEEPAPVKHMPGEGVGVAEVPRGLLIHHYAIGEDGRITAANCIIPTNQNINNLEHDMRAWVPKVMHKPEPEMQLDLEMLVRAYDPCISCSVHVLKIQS
ncbi:MAG: Ni/Fe hydrogenase subunit alpha, partial [Anaerolineales bacterium]